ncbi:PepSY domain-containing protein [Lacrimispora defluvii]|jgi:uncharacterized membrane protein YkoI|uniref:PepSY domain-containing protein n=1 Tax=Lacrimispora defluvii TaxID=2719233 RepID=A0ABX1W034_9FIRM|nr:PepSY domain-containing protein [Lacrimispora defluvii]NNJ33035.1 hypothetical protein [Lacrimispora defluvii]
MKKKSIVLSFIGVLSMVAVVSAVPASQLVKANNATNKTTENSEEKDDELTLENANVTITEEQAKTTALDSIQGGTFVSIELEDEDGVIVYGVNILSGNTENDVKIDANTGVILKTESGNDTEEIEAKENGSEDQDSDNVEEEDGTESSEGLNE